MHRILGRGVRAVVSGLVVMAFAVVGLAGVAVPKASAADASASALIYDEAPVSADPLPTAQMDGVAWTQRIVGDKVFVGGQFTNARPAGAAAGTNLSPRSNLMAYQLSTGTLLSWAPTANAPVYGITSSSDGSIIYIAGTFTSVNGQARYRVAALNASDGSLINSWQPQPNGRVDSVVVSGNTIFLGGEFTAVSGVARQRVAAVSASTGAVLPFTADVQGGYGVKGVVVSPDGSKVVIDGDFTSVNGSTNPGRGMAALNSTTGASLPWLANSVVRNADMKAGMYSLSSDSDSVYATGWSNGGTAEDGFEGTVRMSWTDGSIIWLEDCHGDTYSVAPINDTVYIASHSHYCGNIGGFPQTNPWGFHHSLAFSKAPTGQTITPDIYGYKSYTGMQAPRLDNWFPNWTVGTFTGQSQAAWNVQAGSDYVVYGGEFPSVNKVAQQGLVRFAVRSIAPNKMGPQTQGGAWALNGVSYVAGQVRLSWTANYDLDSSNLHYSVMRQDKGSTPIYTFDQKSNFYTLPRLTYTDTTVTGGQSYNYRIVVSDDDGNKTNTDWLTVQAATTGQATTYNNAVLNDAPTSYWPMGEPSGTAAYDWAGGTDLSLAGATRGQSGQQVNATSQATGFSGSSSSFGSTSSSVAGPQTFSAEAWFKTTSTAGGKILGFGSSASGNSSSYDRQIYLSGNGTVTFGVYPGSVQTVSSTSGFNDGQWHHVVGTLGSAGLTLWLDGKLIGQNPNVTSAQSYSGYWRVGGDNLSGWPNVGSSTYLSGSIADVAVYATQLTRQQVNAHWVASGRASSMPASPADAYGKAVYDLDPTLYWRLDDASASSTAADAGMNAYPGTYYGSSTRQQPGALSGVSTDRSVRFAGQGVAVGTRALPGPNTFAEEVWIKTTTTAGGKIVGFGNSATLTPSSNYDRHLYMDTDGKVNFGVWTGQSVILTTPTPLNDGAWHHLVAQESASGMQLYVDGSLVGSNNNTSAQSYSGYWRIGGDSTWAGNQNFDGYIDDVAVYSQPLTNQQIVQHYSLGAFGSVNQPPVAVFTSTGTFDAAHFDASGSSDPDGTIAAYEWSFGDGTTGSGATVDHTFAAAGTYQVTLTVTDNRGARTSLTQQFQAKAPNAAPVAAFTSTANFLAASFDASTSSDPDGTISSYSWAFGDGQVGLGKAVTHNYTAAGTYQVSLTVTDNDGASTTKVDSITVTAPPNQPPVASFTTSASGLSLTVNGSASSDPDGTVSSYAWDFGDGATGTGSTKTHDYAQAGSYTVKLTVTDDKGATGQTTSTVTVNSQPVLASDSFARSLTSSWGTADTGGSWVLSYGNSEFAVAGGKGTIALQPSWSRLAMLPAVQSSSAQTSVKFSSTTDFGGGPQAITLIGRQVGSTNYAARARIESGNIIRLYILRDETALGASYVIPNYTYSPGDVLNLSVSVTGTSPTTVKGWVWVNGTSKPSSPNLTATDSTSGLQAAGSIGIKVTSAAASTVNRLLTFTDFQAIDPSGVTPPAVNQSPVAAFTSQVSGLGVSVDGSGSSDPDGSVASYAWDFGDSATGSGATASHTYGQAGTYQVKLTVTDDKGAKDSVTKSVTVTAPPAVVLAKDDFARTGTGSWGSADTGGTWTLGGGSAAFGVANGQGVITLAPSQTRTAQLNSVSTQAVVEQMRVSFDEAPAGAAAHITLIGRQVGGDYYGGRLRIETDGTIRLYVLLNETALANSYVLPNTKYTAGDVLHLKVQVSGTAPTTVKAKVWRDGTTEPDNWNLSSTDATAALQTSGSIGIRAVVGASSSVPATHMRIDSLVAEAV